jgi:hypothetical protein
MRVVFRKEFSTQRTQRIAEENRKQKAESRKQ